VTVEYYIVKKLITWTLRLTVIIRTVSSRIKGVRYGKIKSPYKALSEKPYARDLSKERHYIEMGSGE
jgi:hypothetical protein